LRYLCSVPTFHILLLKSMLTGVTTWIFFAWLPLYLRETFQLTLGAAGFAGTFTLQATKVAGILCGGWISDRFGAGRGERRLLVLAACYLCAAPFLLIFLTTPGLLFVSLAIAAFSLFGGMGLANEQPTLAEVVPAKYRSTAIGVSNTFATAAGGLGVLLAGLLKSQVGLDAIFAASCIIYLVTAGFIVAAYFRFAPADIQKARAAEGEQRLS
jgi:MFS family permease